MIRKETNAEVLHPLLDESKLHSTRLLNCPRCDSTKTKFRYYNNNCKTQPRYICLDCKRYWTEGGTIRNASMGGHKEKRASLESSLSLEQPAKAQKKLESLSSTSFLEHPEKVARPSVFDIHPIKYQVSQPPLQQHAKAQKKAETPLLQSSLEQPVKVASLPFSENGHIITLQAKHQASQPPLQQQPAKGQQKAVTLSSLLELPEKAAPLSFLESQVSHPPLEQDSKAQEKGEFLSLPSYLKQSHEFAPLSFSKDFHIGEPQARHQVTQSPLEQLALAAFSKGLSSSATYQGNNLASSCQGSYEILKCPYCNSSDSKLRIYKNHSKQQPQHFCKNCKQLWIASGTLKNGNVNECAKEDKNEMISNVSSPSLKQNGSENETQCLSLSLSLSPSLEQSGSQVGENPLVSFSSSLEQTRDHKHKIMSVHSQKVKPFPSKESEIQEDTKSLSLSLSLSPSLEQSRGQNNEKALVVFSPLLQQRGDQRDKRGLAPGSSSLEHSQKIDASSLDACHAKHLTSGSSLPNEIIRCPRCCSSDTKFRYYNNNNKGQPRYICKNCKRYFTEGGALRNAYAGGSMNENKSHKQKAGTVRSSSLEAASNSLVMANLSNPPLQFPES